MCCSKKKTFKKAEEIGEFGKEAKLHDAKELQDFMSQNISYSSPDNWRLQSAHKTKRTRCGNCHDQALFAEKQLRRMGKKSGRLFFIEHKGSKGGRTHTLPYYIDKDNKVYWLENAWEAQKGIHGPYNSIEDLKKHITTIHHNETESKKYPDITFGQPPKYKRKIDLSKYVESSLSKKAEEVGEFGKEARLHDITCEVCGYTGQPDDKGRCPQCFALCGKKPAEYYKENDDPRTIADSGSI